MLAITGGGTGGHLCIVRSLAQELQARGHDLLYIGSTSGQDKAWFENSPLFKQCFFLDTIGVVDKSFLRKIQALYKQVLCTQTARNLLKKHHIQALISVGGFSAGPGSFAGILSKIPLYIHEQNAVQGALNRLITPYAKCIFSSFKSTEPDPKRVYTPYPIHHSFFENARIRTEVRTILFLGGSQGARAINEFALLCARKLLKKGLKVIHQCGNLNYERVANVYKGLGLLDQVDLFAFDLQLVEKMRQADICVSRAGASSVWELCANNLPTLFVPYPFAAKNHQYYNALEFAKEGLAKIVEQTHLHPDHLFNFIEWLETPKQEGLEIASVSQGLRQKVSSGGAGQIVDRILEQIES
ncbi:undecaprenyldiphospho-muramoylpentapeptide beta-N-acetylglucosaminyltransferase [Helicobacter ailurogastricus]|uniref:UDP-N-acetylglucosamine--N-acetylmuramyl-(pentapeptide) pyrophosphoryl-undecaprenol N-acetylglucosamine transferase n=1 Tax=Helicobacter ailurogastricus TaxID=1578720 RepID=A0A0K2XD17_9HELI|nr:undecaprenyldiphospho-muramoylpentapeptide beta-N-acetylglucosaminyltransferase [Helicobacter ailurogastricus]CRF40480.1 UDP-N-acetylglucosamine--N-acetylmuramyl-(pentapeptide) pyrophosphoryl-undecaprenol N-acetylglucosamine transferase [Helicobacter ailurogastricus]CRF43453.1 UDP-N-acetylglucosamine--N-acetylmuramyl-(pentapeptide) pyrophosphoryl-undecaprenol N-acetylglucosamine transferase [Helicobacter ailurogastricus]CRF44006.1 UDP-N-acetylglucosamine--N-acetylmuramyl-(pentapeptide) pyroph